MTRKLIVKLCMVCDEELLDGDNKFMMAIENPYLNIYVHKSCYNEIKDNLKEFLSENLPEYLNKRHQIE